MKRHAIINAGNIEGFRDNNGIYYKKIEKEDKIIVLYRPSRSKESAFRFIEIPKYKGLDGYESGNLSINFSPTEDYIIFKTQYFIVIVDKDGKKVCELQTRYFNISKDSMVYMSYQGNKKIIYKSTLDGTIISRFELPYNFSVNSINYYNKTWIIDSRDKALIISPIKHEFIDLRPREDILEGAYIEKSNGYKRKSVYNINGDFVDVLSEVFIADDIVAGIPDGASEYVFYKSIFNNDGSTEIKKINVFPAKSGDLTVQSFRFFNVGPNESVRRLTFKNYATNQIYDIVEGKIYNLDDYHYTSKVEGYKYYYKTFLDGRVEIFNGEEELVLKSESRVIYLTDSIIVIGDYIIDLKRGIKIEEKKSLKDILNSASLIMTNIKNVEDGSVVYYKKYEDYVETVVYDKNLNFLTSSLNQKDIRIIIVDGLEKLVYKKRKNSPYIDAEGNEYNIKDYQEVILYDVYIEYDSELEDFENIKKYFEVKGKRYSQDITNDKDLGGDINFILNHLAYTGDLELAEIFSKTLDSYNEQLESILEIMFDREISKIEDNPFLTRNNTFDTPESIERRINSYVNSYLEVIKKASELLETYKELTSLEKLLQHEELPEDLSDYSISEYMPLINKIYELNSENKKSVSEALLEDIKIAKQKINRYIEDIVVDGVVEEQEIIDTKKSIMMNLNKTYLRLSNNLIVSIEKEKREAEEHYNGESGKVFSEAENHIIANYKNEFEVSYNYIIGVCEKYMNLNDTPTNKKLTIILSEYLEEANKTNAEISESNELEKCKELLIMIYRIQDRIQKVVDSYLVLENYKAALKNRAMIG